MFDAFFYNIKLVPDKLQHLRNRRVRLKIRLNDIDFDTNSGNNF